MIPVQKHMRSSAGFTLVELAIVMIIIGLLIAGVLKGQQLITNAQIAATVAQVKAFDAATTSFKDMYAVEPGDMTAAQEAARLPNCTAANLCLTAGNGDGKIDVVATGAAIQFTGAAAGEQLGFWSHLNATGLVTSIAPTNVAALGNVWGGDYPSSKISGGGFDVGWNSGLAAVPLSGLISAVLNATQSGTYLALHGTPNAAAGVGAADLFLRPNYAKRIDTKVDDSSPNTGDILAAGAAGAANCVDVNTQAGVYNEQLPNSLCALYIKFQN
jgi:prepilin-type N-terminal cleavage/methylation domain-containing protein